MLTAGSPIARVLQALYALDEPLADGAPGLVDVPGALMMLWDHDTGGYVKSPASSQP